MQFTIEQKRLIDELFGATVREERRFDAFVKRRAREEEQKRLKRTGAQLNYIGKGMS
jgi:hypothetical protein